MITEKEYDIIKEEIKKEFKTIGNIYSEGNDIFQKGGDSLFIMIKLKLEINALKQQAKDFNKAMKK